MMLRRDAAPIRIGNNLPFSDGQKGVVCFIILRRREEGLVCRDDGQSVAVRQSEQFPFDQAVILKAVTLNFHIELAAEGVCEDIEPRLRQVLTSAVAQGAIERSREAA